MLTKKTFTLILSLNIIFGLVFILEVVASIGLLMAMAMSFDTSDHSYISHFLHLGIITLILGYPITYLLSLIFSIYFGRKNRPRAALRSAYMPGVHLALLVLIGLFYFH